MAKICLLLTLSAELRNPIWETLLLTDNEITVPCTTPSLLQTCRQIRGEGRAIFFAVNTFHIMPQIQQFINEQARRRRRGAYCPAAGKVPSEHVMQWLRVQRDLLPKIKRIHITASVMPMPRCEVSRGSALRIVKYSPYIEWVIDFAGTGSEQTITSDSAATTLCKECGRLDRFQDRSSVYWILGLHAGIKGCTLHAAFAFPSWSHSEDSKAERKQDIKNMLGGLQPAL